MRTYQKLIFLFLSSYFWPMIKTILWVCFQPQLLILICQLVCGNWKLTARSSLQFPGTKCRNSFPFSVSLLLHLSVLVYNSVENMTCFPTTHCSAHLDAVHQRTSVTYTKIERRMRVRVEFPHTTQLSLSLPVHLFQIFFVLILLFKQFFVLLV